MTKSNKTKSIFLFFCIFSVVALVPPKSEAREFREEEIRIQFVFETEKYAVMDSIVSYIDKTLECSPTDTLKKYHKTGNYQINIYPINTKEYSYESKQAAFCEFEESGTYDIHLFFYEPNEEDMFKFKYTGVNFLTSTFLDGFFNEFKGISFYQEIPIDDEIDDLGDICNWRFIVQNGKIISAKIWTNTIVYDLQTQNEISLYDYFKVLPYPVEKYSSLEEWDNWIGTISKDLYSDF